MNYFLIIMGALSAFYLTLGFIVSKSVRSHTDFFFAGKGLGVFAITATLLASQIGGGMFIGTTNDPFRGLLYIIGMVLGFLALGFGVAEKFRGFNVETLGEIFTTSYKSRTLGIFCSLLSVATMCGILLAQAVAAKMIILDFAGLNDTYLFPFFWCVVIGYTLLGGLQAVILTDMIQIGIVITIFTALFLYSVWIEPVSFFSGPTATKIYALFTASDLTWQEMLNIVITTLLFSLITQDLAHRFFAAKDKTTAGLAALYASVLLLFFGIVPFYFGLQAYLYNLDLSQSAGPLVLVLQRLVTGLPLALAVCALMAAITSTIDSLLCAVSCVLASLFKSYMTKPKDEVRFSQAFTLFCGLAILGGSYLVPNSIITILMNSYELSVSCLIVPLLFACFKKTSLNSVSAKLSVAFGFMSFLFFKIYPMGHLTPFVTLALSLFAYLVGDFFVSLKKGKISS